MQLSWKLVGDEIRGFVDVRDEFAAYAVKEAAWIIAPSYEAWSQRGKTPELLGTFGGPQAAMRACEEDCDEKEAV